MVVWDTHCVHRGSNPVRAVTVLGPSTPLRRDDWQDCLGWGKFKSTEGSGRSPRQGKVGNVFRRFPGIDLKELDRRWHLFEKWLLWDETTTVEIRPPDNGVTLLTRHGDPPDHGRQPSSLRRSSGTFVSSVPPNLGIRTSLNTLIRVMIYIRTQYLPSLSPLPLPRANSLGVLVLLI